MSSHFINSYREYLTNQLTGSRLSELNEELDKVSDEELWETMLNAADDDNAGSAAMPSDIKVRIRRNLYTGILRRRMFSIARYAAVALVILSVGLGVGLQLHHDKPDQTITASVKPGNKSEITLPDGTAVRLNGASTLAYDMSQTDRRIVRLNGEAFFDVTKNPKRPFVVMVDDLSIEVLGTSFNVNTYRKDIVETSLVTGRISLTSDDLAHSYILQPGEKAIYNALDKEITITPADIHVDTGWCDDYLIFDSKPFTEVIEDIERWYGVEIEMQHPELASDRLSGSFRHEDINTVMTALSIQYKFKYRIYKDRIIIY